MNALTIKRSYIFILLVFFSTSCSISLLPPYSQEISSQIDAVTKDIERLYLKLLEQPIAQRKYDAYSETYINIEVELSSLYKKNKLRPKNVEATRSYEIALEKWQDYRQDHKQKGVLTDGIIGLNRKFMADILFSIQLTENVKQ